MMSNVHASAEVWSAAVTAFEQRLRSLVDDVHADWLMPWAGIASVCTTAWRDWACLLQVDRPTLSELADPMMRLALFPAAQAQRIFVMRALLPKRSQVRTCIDPVQRSKLTAVVGHSALQLLVLEGCDVLHKGANQETLDVASLAWEGYQWFANDGAWRDEAGLARLLRLRFPRDAAPLSLSVADPAASLWVLQRLPLFVEEQSWWSDSTGMIFMSTWN